MVSSTEVAENSPSGFVIGWIQTEDRNLHQSHTYKLNNYTDMFDIQGQGTTAKLAVIGKTGLFVEKGLGNDFKFFK